MTEAVIDATIAVKWVVEEEHSDKAVLLLAYDICRAPDHWQAEAVNALRAKVFKGDLDAADADERMQALLRAPVIGAPISGLMQRAFAISLHCAVTVYDSLYIALAERHDIPLVTADRRLIQRVAGHPNLRDRVVWVGSLD